MIDDFLVALKGSSPGEGKRGLSKAIKSLIAAVKEAKKAGEQTITGIRMPKHEELLVDDDDVETIVNCLIATGMPIEELNLANNDIGDAGVASVSRLLGDEPGYACNLHTLDLHGNCIGAKGSQLLADKLCLNSTLASLDMSWNAIGLTGGLHMAAMLESNVGLTSLHLNKADLTDAGVIALAAALRHNNCSLKELGMSGQHIRSKQEDFCKHIARMLVTNRSIEALYLSKCGIGDDGASMIREALVEGSNDVLRALDLSSNEIGTTGGEALAKLLMEQFSCLEYLDLRCNRIGDGALAFESVLACRHSRLKVLDLSWNGIEEPGLCAMGRGMERNASLSELHLWGNHWGKRSLSTLHALLEGRFALTGVQVDCKPYVVDGTYMVAQTAIVGRRKMKMMVVGGSGSNPDPHAEKLNGGGGGAMESDEERSLAQENSIMVE